MTPPTFPSSVESISEESRARIALEVREAGGAEVFLIGRVERGRVVEVTAVARGTERQVPVFLERAAPGEVLIHNHPGGDLRPSEADLHVASEAGMRGLGFYIVDDRAERVFRVVEPDEAARDRPVDLERVEDIFAPGGLLAQAIPEFEDRPGQRALARSVAEAFNGGVVAALEAGTGVGKSFAYLVPAILWATANAGRVVVSTQTIALGEQLVHKDLPRLARVLDELFRFSLIKGRNNYACRRKSLEQVESLERGEEDPERRNWIVEIWQRLEHDAEGSLSSLERTPPDDVWSDFQSASEHSLRASCPHYSKCFFYEARRRAARAHILVVNHHLFFADLAVRRASGGVGRDVVIPAYSRVVLDEGHRVEEAACEHLGTGLSRVGLLRTLGRFAAPPRRRGLPEKGRLPLLARTLGGRRAPRTLGLLEEELMPRVRAARDGVREVFSALAGMAGCDAEPEGRISRRGAGGTDAGLGDGHRGKGHRAGEVGEPAAGERRAGESVAIEAAPAAAAETRTLPVGWGESDIDPRTLAEPLVALRGELADLRRCFREAHAQLLGEPFEPEDRYAGALAELRGALATLDGLDGEIESLLQPAEGVTTWLEWRGGRTRNLAVRAAPVRVAEILAEHLYETTDTVILTSATLAVDGCWEYLADRLGLDLIEKDRFVGACFPSPFDHAEQVMLALPEDLPPPNDAGYDCELARCVERVATAARGRTFVLFTSHRALRSCARRVAPGLQQAGLPALVQGEAPTIELVRRFRRAGNAVLFGTHSFWEGVDVPGAALSCVIIARLPFRVPDHPLEQARAEEVRERGGHPFVDLTVPQAVLTLKQGFGRLVRTASDRGVVLIADSRIRTRPYGRTFLESLPACGRVIGPCEEVEARIGEFFATPEASAGRGSAATREAGALRGEDAS